MITQSVHRTIIDYEKVWASPDEEEHSLVHEFIYPGNTTIIYADEGIGKSTIATQLAVSAACALPVFGVLDVPNPLRVYYLAFETRFANHARMVKRMHDELKFDLALFKENFKFDPDQVDLDLQHADVTGRLIDSEVLLLRILSVMKAPQLIVLDPIYLAVCDDLAEGPAARAVAAFANKVASICGAAVLLIHHTHRKKYDFRGNEVDEAEPIYGSRWLKAHVAVAWLLKQGGNGTVLTLTKDRFSLSRKEIPLRYNMESMVSTCDFGLAKGNIAAKLVSIFKGSKGQVWTYEALATALGCHPNYLRVPLSDPEIRKLFKREAERGKATRFISL